MPKKATQKSLQYAALHYLERFATSSENLRRVLMRRVQRSVYHHNTDPEEGQALIDDVVRRYQKIGLLNDQQYAEARVSGLNRRGTSKKLTRLKLMEKGVAEEVIAQALETLNEEEGNAELRAALNLARKKKMGPYRLSEEREGKRERDMAAMARAGFSYDMVKKVIEADKETLIELEQLAENRYEVNPV